MKHFVADSDSSTVLGYYGSLIEIHTSIFLSFTVALGLRRSGCKVREQYNVRTHLVRLYQAEMGLPRSIFTWRGLSSLGQCGKANLLIRTAKKLELPDTLFISGFFYSLR